MFKKRKTFIKLCLEGYVEISEVDEYIENWHKSKEKIPLNEFLGMSTKEYALWVEKPQSLRFILHSRKHNIPFHEAMQQLSNLPLAARAADAKELDKVKRWLKKKGRI